MRFKISVQMNDRSGINWFLCQHADGKQYWGGSLNASEQVTLSSEEANLRIAGLLVEPIVSTVTLHKVEAAQIH